MAFLVGIRSDIPTPGQDAMKNETADRGTGCGLLVLDVI